MASPARGRAQPAKTGWDEEESLDLDMVSAICPNCRIILVEANSAEISDLGTGVNAAVSLGAKFVSNSYNGPEQASDTTDDNAYFKHPGVALTAAGGDTGYGVGYPAASRYVTSVGGTSLVRRGGTARGWSETVWNDASGATGSGCSAREAKPSWQTDTGCSRRTDNDVAAIANPDTGVAVYDTYGSNHGWQVFGGTSAATPIIAATYALAGPPASSAYPAQFPYLHTSRLHDITSGSDGSCGGSYLCTARTGFDGPTGWGTPDGTGAFQATDHKVTVTSPGTRHSARGKKIASVRIKARDSASAQTLRFTASGLPSGLSVSTGGVISGTPKARGYYSVTVHATDGTGMTGSASFLWSVASAGAVRSQLAGKCVDDQARQHRRRHQDPDLHVPRGPGPGLDRLSQRHGQAAAQAHQGHVGGPVPDRAGQPDRGRHQGRAAALQRIGRPGVAGQGERPPGQPAVGQVPGRPGRRADRHPAGDRGLRRAGRAALDPALADPALAGQS